MQYLSGALFPVLTTDTTWNGQITRGLKWSPNGDKFSYLYSLGDFFSRYFSFPAQANGYSYSLRTMSNTGANVSVRHVDTTTTASAAYVTGPLTPWGASICNVRRATWFPYGDQFTFVKAYYDNFAFMNGCTSYESIVDNGYSQTPATVAMGIRSMAISPDGNSSVVAEYGCIDSGESCGTFSYLGTANVKGQFVNAIAQHVDNTSIDHVDWSRKPKNAIEMSGSANWWGSSSVLGGGLYPYHYQEIAIADMPDLGSVGQTTRQLVFIGADGRVYHQVQWTSDPGSWTLAQLVPWFGTSTGRRAKKVAIAAANNGSI